MPNIGAPELIIIAVALVVLFGATKLPTFARSVGRSLRIFKSEVKGLQKDDEDDVADQADAKSTATQDKAEAAKPELTEAKPTTETSDASSSAQPQRAVEQR